MRLTVQPDSSTASRCAHCFRGLAGLHDAGDHFEHPRTARTTDAAHPKLLDHDHLVPDRIVLNHRGRVAALETLPTDLCKPPLNSS